MKIISLSFLIFFHLSCDLFSSIFLCSAANLTISIPPNLPDFASQPQNCLSSTANDQCNLRSGVGACSTILTDSFSWCTIILSPGDLIFINQSLGALELLTRTGSLVIIGNKATIISQSFSTNIPNARFLTMASTTLTHLTATISNITFHHFSSSNSGGVFNFQNLDSLTLSDLSFTNNTAVIGGAVYLDDCREISIVSCTFLMNTAVDGGAIAFDSGNLNILVTSSSFHLNIATSYSNSDRNQGGAIYFNILNNNVEISECSFLSNQAINGGGVYFHTENSEILIRNCFFEKNSASFGGGLMLYNQNLYATVIDSLFYYNTAIAFYGGGVFTYSSNFDTLLQNLTFYRNSAFYGGGLNADSDNTNLRLISCHFWNNTAHFGAAFTLYSSHQVTLIHDCTFRYNQAISEAGAVYVVSINEDIEVYNCEFLNNEAGTNGGAFTFVNGNTNITFKNSLFLSNKAGKAGGGIYSALTTTHWQAISCVFRDNHATTNGGALSLGNDNEYFSLHSSDLVDNSANIGGAIFVGNTNNHVVLTSCNISGNDATSFGGGVTSLSANFAIYSSHLLDNTAMESGGMHLDENTNTIIFMTNFERNIAQSGTGGGCSILGKGIVRITSCNFTENTAANGGGLYLTPTEVVMSQNNFKSNEVTQHGGAIYSSNIVKFTISSHLFLNNVAVISGGAIHATQITEFSVNTTSFMNNMCSGQLARGAALYVSSSNATINDNKFHQNKILNGAGTIFWMHSTMREPTDLLTNQFQSNSALYGEDMATEGYTLMIPNIVNVSVYAAPITSFNVSLVDFYQQNVKTDSSSIVDFSLESTSNPSCHNGEPYLTGGLLEGFTSGVALVDQLEAHCSPGGILNAYASTYLTEIDFDLIVPFQIAFRECRPGEIDVQGDCQRCSEFYYSFDPTELSCRACPENAICPGGNILIVEKNYWRQCQTCHLIEHCRLTGVCHGGENVSHQCREGHTGPLCNLCEENYALGPNSKCSQCTTNSSLIPLILGPILLLLTLSLLLLAYLKRHLLLLTIQTLINFIQHTIEKYRLDSFQTKIKIFISFIQILNSLPVMFNVDYPLLFKQFLESISFSNLNFLSLFSVGCVWNSNFYDSLLLHTIGPMVAMLLLCSLLHLRMVIAYRLNKTQPSYTRQDRNEQMELLCIFIAFLVFSPSSIHIFQTFVCEEFEDGTITLVVDSSLSCETMTWKYYVVYASLMCVVYPLGIPLLYLYSLFTYLEEINPPNNLVVMESEIQILNVEIIQKEKIKFREMIPKIRGLSFLFSSYLPKNWYFEVLECFRRLLLTSIPILFLRSTVLQIVLVLLISLGFCVVYMELRPFVNSSDNLAAISSQWAITMTVLGSLCLRVDMTDEINAFGPGAIGILMTIVNIFAGILTFVAAIRTDEPSPTEERKRSTIQSPFPFPDHERSSFAQNKKFSEMDWSRNEKKKDSDDDSDDDSSDEDEGNGDGNGSGDVEGPVKGKREGRNSNNNSQIGRSLSKTGKLTTTSSSSSSLVSRNPLLVGNDRQIVVGGRQSSRDGVELTNFQ